MHRDVRLLPKADMSHLMSLSGAKRTYRFALHMSAFDPKRTSDRPLTRLVGTATMPTCASGRQ
jgi:hypothetical protein